jgi:sensor histidine kinase YesM
MQVTTEKVLALANQLSEEKLIDWYEFGIFLRERSKLKDDDLEKEFGEWEAASDEDWLKFENHFAETK